MIESAGIVRAFEPEDVDALAQIHNRSFPAEQMRPNSLARYFNDVIRVGGHIWTVSDGERLVGYAYVAPVPGLDGVLDLQGCIDPGRRRQGFGSYLLKVMIDRLKEIGRFQLSHAVHSLAGPAARFLQSRQFIVEHVERQMILENPERLAPAALPSGFRLATFPLGTAVPTFRKAYDAAFAGLPWYQPYTGDGEITADLEDPTDLLFLLDGEKTAGFAWLRMPEPDLGEVEPFGLLPAYQGKGLGAKFLTAAIQQLVPMGAERIRIGAWERNERAIHLYQRLGFKAANTQTYLAYPI